jgi:hypothetical protein
MVDFWKLQKFLLVASAGLGPCEKFLRVAPGGVLPVASRGLSPTKNSTGGFWGLRIGPYEEFNRGFWWLKIGPYGVSP